MKIKDGFMLREVAGSYVVMNLGGENSFNGMITLNETGALIWNAVNAGKCAEDIARRITDEYEIDIETAMKDVNAFIAKMKDSDIIEE